MSEGDLPSEKDTVNILSGRIRKLERSRSVKKYFKKYRKRESTFRKLKRS